MSTPYDDNVSWRKWQMAASQCKGSFGQNAPPAAARASSPSTRIPRRGFHRHRQLPIPAERRGAIGGRHSLFIPATGGNGRELDAPATAGVAYSPSPTENAELVGAIGECAFKEAVGFADALPIGSRILQRTLSLTSQPDFPKREGKAALARGMTILAASMSAVPLADGRGFRGWQCSVIGRRGSG